MEVQNLYSLLFFIFYGHIGCTASPSPSTKFYPRSNNVNPTEEVIKPKTTPIIVETKVGFIRGTVVDSGNGAITSRFIGIPYALPPVDDRRFKDPVKHPGYAMGQTWNATHYRPACPQDTSRWKTMLHPDVFNDRVDHDRTSEDCLYLDLYIPRNLSSVEHINTLSLPVMIYIHGGDFQHGTAMLRGGHRLASHGDVIVAGINFRLGVLGFLSLLADDASGNFGLKDQRLAIHWIWDNIREIGGDPERITIFGDSSGALSVGYHVASPLSRGLFTRAISQSGTMLDPSVIDKTPQEKVIKLSKSVDCPTLSYKKMMKCLRKVPTPKLLSAANEITQRWYPVIDGKFLTKDPLQLLLAGEMNHVDYIIGVTSHEGYSSRHTLPSQYNIDNGLSANQLDDLLIHYTGKYFARNYQQVRTALNLEYYFCSKNTTALSETLVDFVGDLQFNAPADRVSRLFSRGTGRFIYFYEFSQRSSFIKDERPSFIKADHGEDVEYIFGHVRDVIRGATLEERRLSHAMMSGWTNFARTGDPNPLLEDGGVVWGRYTEEDRKYIRFTTSLDSSSSRSHFRAQQMALWNDYLPYLLQNSPCDEEKNHCEKQTAPIKEKKAQATIALWVLTAICVFLCFVILILLAKIYVPPRVWAKWKRHSKPRVGNETETKKLHPLPYVDENT